MRRWLVTLLLAPGAALAQPVACPLRGEVELVHLLGQWRAEFEGLPGATLQVEKHPAYALSFAGGIERESGRGRIVGDVEDGALTLEESADGQRIAATWLGDVVEGSCGREIRGTWQATGAADAVPFVLKKVPGW